MFKPIAWMLGLLLALSPAFAPAAEAPAKPFELLDGDRVLLVGGTFIEREGTYGQIETLLTTRFPDRHLTFRVLGQSGDTVQADARNLNSGWAQFGPNDQGYNRLKKLVEEFKPTVIVGNYGMTESFEGVSKLSEFVKGYDRLIDMLATSAGGKPRLVLLSPNYHEDLGRPAPEPGPHNAALEKYRDAIKDIADRRSARFVDVFAITRAAATEGSPRLLTNNGVHLSPAGYQRLAAELAKELALPPSKMPAEQMERVRKCVVAKNAEFFNYWRPQNDTYILGYRKKEQGRNAKEMPQFLTLAEEREKEIAAAVAGK